MPVGGCSISRGSRAERRAIELGCFDGLFVEPEVGRDPFHGVLLPSPAGRRSERRAYDSKYDFNFTSRSFHPALAR